MDLLDFLITVVAGVGMGAINNLAGGAGVFGLMAFEHAYGLPLVLANPSMRPAALCVGLFAFLGYRKNGHHVPRRTWLQSLWTLPGVPAGSWLVLHLPDLVFWLYLCCVLGLLLRQQTRRADPAAPPRRDRPVLAAFCYFLIGAHMGYAQVGVGLLSTLLLTATSARGLIDVTAAKSALVVLTSLAAVITLGSVGAIAWVPASALALGCAFGSYQASRWAIQKGAGAVRGVVVVITVLTLAYALYKAYVTAS